MIHENQIEAYNIPSGILFHMHLDAAAKRPGVLTQVGIDTYVDPRRDGGRMNECTTEEIVELVQFDGRGVALFPRDSDRRRDHPRNHGRRVWQHFDGA